MSLRQTMADGVCVECDASNVPEYVSVRRCESVNYTNNSLLGRALALARRAIQDDNDGDGVLAQILRHNPLHLLTPDKLLIVRRVLSSVCSSDMSATIDRLLRLLLDK
ncbi:ORF153 [Betabaculovirus altermyunipunctae]|uniref:ORF153 n=1 Tax=Betabaculovirus altermyunipunctae TaxID=3051996 RepID=A0A1S5YE27_9BBAC|nr:ORF153 [Betabaculovirus altermyunipunctae]AQQ80419.1 ORF153 [Betabaculovirus altermyunipunctae]